ncbi:MAG: Glu/Leu/Phe/Val dehydrogenase [Anaerolineae bacterium]|nr:Glu/Leu/Phe/Val dehydrogenase [Anaerolineae bacterium]
MRRVLPEGDELGPFKVVHVDVPAVGLKGVLVVDNVAAGPAIGGLRISPTVDAVEVARLARAMTLKSAIAALPHGGAKSAILADPHLPRERKEQLVRAFARALASECDYIFGPDMGSDETAMAWVKDEIGRATGLPRALGGIPLDEVGATGWGLRHAAEVAAGFCGLKLTSARVAVQGFGAVGRHAARFLTERGAVVVAAADSSATVYDPRGLEVARLIEYKAAGGRFADWRGGEVLPPQAVLEVECDVLIPAAQPDVIHPDNAERVKARLVLEGANIPVTEAAEQALHARGVLCVPDIVANAGGVICAALEYRGATQATAFAAIEERLRAATEWTLKTAREVGITPRAAALQLARRNLDEAMASRRFGLF